MNVDKAVLSNWQVDSKIVRCELSDYFSVCVQFLNLSSQNEEKIIKLFN